jgi:probable phosphomutase (TIGR03848 family)
MARLLLIRHAPTAETGRKLTGRLPGVELGEKGQQVAERLAQRLADLKLDAVYASPIERTWETAEIVARPHGLTPIREDGLLEIDFGNWSGRTFKQLTRLKLWRTVQMTPSRVTFPGGEAMADMQRRAVATCERLAASSPKGTIALVSHADVIKAIVSHYLGQPFDLFQRIVISPASVSVIELPPEGPPAVLAVNATGAEGTWR